MCLFIVRFERLYDLISLCWRLLCQGLIRSCREFFCSSCSVGPERTSLVISGGGDMQAIEQDIAYLLDVIKKTQMMIRLWQE